MWTLEIIGIVVGGTGAVSAGYYFRLDRFIILLRPKNRARFRLNRALKHAEVERSNYKSYKQVGVDRWMEEFTELMKRVEPNHKGFVRSTNHYAPYSTLQDRAKEFDEQQDKLEQLYWYTEALRFAMQKQVETKPSKPKPKKKQPEAVEQRYLNQDEVRTIGSNEALIVNWAGEGVAGPPREPDPDFVRRTNHY